MSEKNITESNDTSEQTLVIHGEGGTLRFLFTKKEGLIVTLTSQPEESLRILPSSRIFHLSEDLKKVLDHGETGKLVKAGYLNDNDPYIGIRTYTKWWIRRVFSFALNSDPYRDAPRVTINYRQLREIRFYLQIVSADSAIFLSQKQRKGQKNT